MPTTPADRLWKPLGERVVEQMWTASRNGLLMTDIKPENIVLVEYVQPGRRSRPLRKHSLTEFDPATCEVFFIDFDGRFSTFVDLGLSAHETSECIFLANAMLFLGYIINSAFMYPRHLQGEDTTDARMPLDRLMRMYDLMEPTARELIAALPRVRQQSESGLIRICKHLFDHRGYIRARGRESIVDESPAVIATAVLERAEAYGRWSRQLGQALGSANAETVEKIVLDILSRIKALA